MSLKVGSISQVPEDTARVAKAVFRKSNRYILLRDTFGDFFLAGVRSWLKRGVLLFVIGDDERLAGTWGYSSG